MSEYTEAKLDGSKVIAQFVLGGNSTFTVVSKRTGSRLTFKVGFWEERNMYIVKVLTGPDNENDYRKLGKIKNGIFSLTDAARENGFTVETRSFSVFSWLLRNLQSEKIDDQIEIWHAGRCGRCGRKLTVPESIETGLGPECAEKGFGGF
jgi:hypothetical protein